MVQKTTARCIMQTGACLSLCLCVSVCVCVFVVSVCVCICVCFCLCVLHIMRVDGKWCKAK